jgi:octaprenyl-diphosphate synthase
MANSQRQTSAPSPRSPQEILAPLSRAMTRFEQFLEEQCDTFESGVAHCARYVVSNQGKRLRPALAIFSASSHQGGDVDEPSKDLLTICAIVELVHMATLVHDDIMDEAEIRRSRLTADAKWGHEISVLLGDCLFAHALSLSASFPTPYVCRRIAEATNVVCSGEILQTQRRFDLKLSKADYFKMIEMKTGALFAVACELGSHVAGASESVAEKYYEFGRLLGIAYQIYDDCLDLVGSEKEIGKSLGTDLQKGKLTLPLIHLLEDAQQSEIHLISSILLNEHANSRGMLLDFVKRYQTLQKAARFARSTLTSAKKELSTFGDNAGRQALFDLVAYLDGELARIENQA